MLSHTQKECSFVNISSCTVAKDYEQGGVCLLNNNWPLLRRLMLIGWNLPLAEMLQHHLHYHTHWSSAEKVLGMPHLITTSKFHAYFKAQCNIDLQKGTVFENYSKILIFASEASNVIFLENLVKCFFAPWKFFSILRFYSKKRIGKNL